MFKQLEKHGLKLKASNASFSRIKYSIVAILSVMKESREILTKKAVLKDCPAPSNIKDLRSFRVCAGYYRRFVCNYSKVAKPLNSLLVGHPTNKKGKKTKSATPWIWIH